MRTTITLDSQLVNALQQVSKTRTKSKAVILAIEDFLKKRQLLKIKELKGKIKFTLSADEIRHAQR